MQGNRKRLIEIPPSRILQALAALVLGAGTCWAAGIESIDQFHRVSDRVAMGAQPTPEQVTALANDGFVAILNLREESEFNDGPQAHAARDAGVLFIRIPVSSQKPSDAAVEKFLTVTDDEAAYPIFIYCASGNRAAALWMVRRVLRDGWTLEKAETEATAAGLTKATLRDFARDYIQRHSPGKPAGS